VKVILCAASEVPRAGDYCEGGCKQYQQFDRWLLAKLPLIASKNEREVAEMTTAAKKRRRSRREGHDERSDETTDETRAGHGVVSLGVVVLML